LEEELTRQARRVKRVKMAAAAEVEKCMVAVVRMLESNNRPFNGTNLVDDLANEFKKSTTVKALAALSEEKTIQVKFFGKVKICKWLSSWRRVDCTETVASHPGRPPAI